MSDAAKPFVERARLLSKLDFTLSQLQNLPDLELMRQVAEINEQLGCAWESMGWSYVALLLDPDTAWARKEPGPREPPVGHGRPLHACRVPARPGV